MIESCPKNCNCLFSPKIQDLIDIVAEMETEEHNDNQIQSLIRLHTDLILYKDSCLNGSNAGLKDLRKRLRGTILDLKLSANHPLSTTLRFIGLPGSPRYPKKSQVDI